MSSGSSLISLRLSTSIASVCDWDAGSIISPLPVSSPVGDAGVVGLTVGCAFPTTPPQTAATVPDAESCGEQVAVVAPRVIGSYRVAPGGLRRDVMAAWKDHHPLAAFAGGHGHAG
uniref:Uncharacterized protein n=1 Tax=Anopheles maculatus TaxID=74869 RepID=A0A182SMR6_9DIPT